MYDCNRLDEQARLLFKEERALTRLDGWFILRETILEYESQHQGDYHIENTHTCDILQKT